MKIHTRSLITRLTRRGVVVALLAATAAPAGLASASTDTTEPASTEPAGTGPTGTESTGTEPAEPADLDTNGDGEVVFGVATPGPRDDGAYYQALVDGITSFAEAQGFAEPIVVDNIDPSQAETELRNLARQDVDVIAVGAGELSDPLAALTEEFPEIFWYCNCGAGLGDVPGIAQALDDSSQISYSAGYATGLLL